MFKEEARGWRWRLVQCNALIVAESSESFERRGDAARAAEIVRAEIGSAIVNML